MRVSVNEGPRKNPKQINILVVGTTKTGPPILGNSHIALVKFNSKLALYQPLTPLKEPVSLANRNVQVLGRRADPVVHPNTPGHSFGALGSIQGAWGLSL